MPVRKDSHRIQVDVPNEWMDELDAFKESEGFRLSQHSAVLLLLREGLDAAAKKNRKKR